MASIENKSAETVVRANGFSERFPYASGVAETDSYGATIVAEWDLVLPKGDGVIVVGWDTSIPAADCWTKIKFFDGASADVESGGRVSTVSKREHVPRFEAIATRYVNVELYDDRDGQSSLITVTTSVRAWSARE